MSKTRIFVSSTCYDLAPVRESLREQIIGLGHEPLLSEYPSFPVNPDITAISNCKTNVEAQADIMVLVIGGRRGTLDKATGKSITNLEYETARLCGTPCFIFVNQTVTTLLSVWRKNPDADFSPIVDNTDVFHFIERIRAENQWVFPFEKTADIKDVLHIQLSAMFRRLLDRNRAGTLDPVPNFSSESLEANRLAGEKPEFWEFLLVAELLEQKLVKVRSRYKRLKAGLVHVPIRFMERQEFFEWIPQRIQELRSMMRVWEAQLPIIQASLGPPGQPGDPQEIKKSVDEFVCLGEQIVDWEEALKSAQPPELYRPLKETMNGYGEFLLKEMEKFPNELRRPFENSAIPTEVKINFVLQAPSFEAFYAEMRRLGQPIG